MCERDLLTPLAAVQVIATDVGDTFFTDAEGRFHTGPLEPGVHRLRAEAPEFESRQLDSLWVKGGAGTESGLILYSGIRRWRCRT